MAVPRTTRWAIEPHTKTKHLILQRYLHAWLPMMAKHNGRILFVDGFAGPGRYSKGEEGSPLIALKALLDHPHFQRPQPQREVVFIFIEREKDRTSALERELEIFTGARNMPNWVKHYVIHGEFAAVITEAFSRLESKGHRPAPTFAFIDPFGFSGVPMKVIARIVKNPRCECLITFMYESINRFLSHPKSEISTHFDELFDTRDWEELLEERIPDRRRDRLVNLYCQQLVTSVGLKYLRLFEMMNRGNRTEYFLVFGTNSEDGLSKMKAAMWKADPIGGRVFSDRTETRQMVFLKPEPDLTPLKNLLRQKFQGHGPVGIEEIQRFVLVDTPYSETIHLKQRTLKPMETDKPPLIKVSRPQDVRTRPGEYPPGTRITFL